MADVTIPAGASDFERASLVALELIRRAVADLPMSFVQNMARSGIFTSAGTTPGKPGVAAGMQPPAAQPQGTESPQGGRHPWEVGKAGAPARTQAESRDVTDPTKKAGGDRGDVSLVVGQLRKVSGVFGDMGNMLRLRFAQLLGPLAILGQTIQANNSGFSVLGQAVRLLGATLAPILLPAVVALAGALLDLSDELKGKIMAGMKTMYVFVMNTLVPMLKFVVNNFELLAVGALAVVATFNPLAAGIIGLVALLSGEIKPGDVTDKALGAMEDILRGRFDKLAGGGVEGFKERRKDAPFAAGVVGDIFKKPEDEVAKARERAEGRVPRSGIDDVIRSLQLQLGPRATTMGPAQLRARAQEAALNADPIEMRIWRVNQEMLRELIALRTAAEEKPAEPRFGGK